MPLKKVKFCRMCQIKLTSSNSYYPKSTHLQCKNCYHKSRTKYVVKYRKSIKGKKATKVAATRAYINHKFKFVARAKELQAKYGERFAVPASLEQRAVDGREY